MENEDTRLKENVIPTLVAIQKLFSRFKSRFRGHLTREAFISPTSCGNDFFSEANWGSSRTNVFFVLIYSRHSSQSPVA